MTISSSTRKAGPYTGNGVTTSFSFSFKVFAASELLVVRTALDGTESNLVLGTDYTVSLNANQNSNPGGSVTALTAPATGIKITITSAIANTQQLDLTNQGGFYPSVINDALDRATIQIQQLDEKVSRSAKLPISSSADADTLSANINRLASSADNVDTVATNISSVNSAATNMAAIIAAPSAASSAAAAQAAAESARDATLAAYDSFDDRYLGTKTSNPTLDNDGNPLVAGALYFNSVAGEMRIYTGSAWVAAYVSGTGFLAVSNNLSDVPNKGTARSNLGLVIGTDVQAFAASATKAEMEAGTEANLRSMSPLRVAQAIVALSSGKINRLINGGMAIDQRNAGASQTFTAASALAYCIDRWYGYCTGANVSGQRVAGTAPNQYAYRFTGAASVTKIGFSQRIEAANCFDMAGQTATLSVELANSLLTSVTWTAWYANTADTFGTLASPTRTQIATGNFMVTSTLTRYSAQINIPSAATTGIEIEFSVGAQTSGTWTIGNAQMETGGAASAFERRMIGTELLLCQGYYQIVNAYFESVVSSASDYSASAYGAADMRATPSLSGVSTSAFNFPSSSGTLAALGSRGAQERRRASGSGAGSFATTIFMSAEL